MFNRRKLIGFGAAGAMAVIAAPFLGKSRATAAVPKVLRVGMSNQLPYAYFENGELTGQSPDVLRAALRESGMEFQGVVSEFGGLIPSLVAGRIDVICTGLWMRPERCKVIAYGNPDSLSRYGLLVKAGNPHGVQGVDDIVSKKLSVAFLRGSVEADKLKAAGVPESQFLALPDMTALVAAVEAGRADAGSNDLIMLTSATANIGEGKVEIISDPKLPAGASSDVDYVAMGFRQSDNDLRELYNSGLAKLIASGELVEINKKWGIPEVLTPKSDTPLAETICQG